MVRLSAIDMLISLFCTYLIGPLASLLPERWRKSLPMDSSVHWGHAAIVSGFLESIAAVVGICYWYMHVMNQVVGGAINLEVNGKIEIGLTEHQISGAGLLAFFLYPLTWALFYFFFEGAVRLCGAAFVESVIGTLPLWLLEHIVRMVKNREEAKMGEVRRANVKSFLGSVRESLATARLKDIPDELQYAVNAGDETLDIRASRKKEDWVVPKIVRVDEVYYRLEDTSLEKGIRPFRYRLRRIQAGVPARNIILYKRGEALVRE